MTINFYKFEGCGNDFIIIDNRKLQKNFDLTQIKKMCDRKFGIGADGLMLFENANDSDFKMVYFNADGKEGSMCGNGGRCMIAFSQYIGIDKLKLRFDAIDGMHEGELLDNNDTTQWLVKLKMLDVDEIIDLQNHYEIFTGSPHYVSFKNNVSSINVYEKGKAIRNKTEYGVQGINVNFVEEKQNAIFVRTYERGVENETLSCGTGVTAAALAYGYKKKLKQGSVNIQTLGGNFKVDFQTEHNSFKNIYLTGPASFVFKGEIDI